METTPYCTGTAIRRWLWVALVPLTVVIASGNTIEAPFMPRVYAPDKVAHVAVFGLIATLFYRALPATMSANSKSLVTILVVCFFGLSDEIHQRFTPGRVFDWYDFAADALGAVLATIAYRWFHPYRRLLEWQICCLCKKARTRRNSATSHP